MYICVYKAFDTVPRKRLVSKLTRKKGDRLENECDNIEQYYRRCNLRFHGIPETGEREDTTAKGWQ